jgi:hypothetical protein
MLIKPAIFDAFPNLIAAESNRHGGISPAPYTSLNLGLNTQDDPSRVDQNRALFLRALQISEDALAAAHQVHGNEVLAATKSGIYEGYDALITAEKGLAVGVTVADCCPVLVYDAQNQAVAAVHAGWRGTTSRVVLAALQQMQLSFKTRPEDCFAYIGTCISQKHYEVDEKVAVQFAEAHKLPGELPGKWHVDLRAANRYQLKSFGVPDAQIETSPYCTWEHNDDYYSHRKEKGTTGRMMAVIGLTAD